MSKKQIILCSVVVVFLLLWFTRYKIYVVNGAASVPAQIVVFDRWTHNIDGGIIGLTFKRINE